MAVDSLARYTANHLRLLSARLLATWDGRYFRTVSANGLTNVTADPRFILDFRNGDRNDEAKVISSNVFVASSLPRGTAVSN